MYLLMSNMYFCTYFLYQPSKIIINERLLGPLETENFSKLYGIKLSRNKLVRYAVVNTHGRI